MSTAMATHSGEYISAKDTLFIATECHLATMQDEDGDTPLHIAVVKGNVLQCIRLCKLFRMAKKSVDVYNKLIQTPLHIATITNKPDIIECLLEFGANPNVPDRYGSTCAHLCAKFHATESLVKYIEKCLTALHVAVNENVMSIFQILVANGADVDAKDTKSGRTPLIYAIEGNRFELVEKLLECDTNVSQQTFSGDTALHIASGRGLQDIVRLLLRRGADATTKNTHSDTPMSLAKSSSVSIILRSDHPKPVPYLPNPASYAEAQYKSHIVKNTTLPMPPHLLKSTAIAQPMFSNNIRMVGKQKIKEEPGDGIPNKRMMTEYKPDMITLSSLRTTTTSVYSQSLSSSGQIMAHTSASNNPIFQQQIPLLPPIFHIPVGPSLSQFSTPQPTSMHAVASDAVMNNRNDDSRVIQQKPESYSSESEVSSEAMMVVAAEEVVPSVDHSSPRKAEQEPFIKFKSEVDDQVNTAHLEQRVFSDKPSTRIIKRTKSCDAKITEHKLTLSTLPAATTNSSKAVVVQYAKPVLEPTALKTEIKNEFIPSESHTSYSQDDSMIPIQSSSDIQPDSKLYQLAKQGMAAAVMAQLNSENLHKSFNLALPKRGPSRQAKIKSGTLELQHLALQGLAVAAMNTKSDEDIEQDKKNHDLAGLGLPPSNVTQIPLYLSKVLSESSTSPGPLQRSISLPSGNNELVIKTEVDDAKLKIESDHQKSILALANATVKKQNVVQAVSAFTMPTTGIPSIPPNQLLRSNSGPSKQTKISLRNAIMDRPIAAAKAIQSSVPNAYTSSTKANVLTKTAMQSSKSSLESPRKGAPVKIAKVQPSTLSRRESLGSDMAANALVLQQNRTMDLTAMSSNKHQRVQSKLLSPTRSAMGPPGSIIHGSPMLTNPATTIARSMQTVEASNFKNANAKALFILNHHGGIQQYGLPETVSSVLPIHENPVPMSVLQTQLQHQLQASAALAPRYMQQVIYMPYGKQQYVPYVVPVTVPDSHPIGIQQLPVQQYQNILQTIPSVHTQRTIQSTVIQSVKEVVISHESKADTSVTSSKNPMLPSSSATSQTQRQKPIAAVTPQKVEEVEEQPLNLSKKPDDQPLNLIRNDGGSATVENRQTMRRPSVIREIPSTEPSVITTTPPLAAIESQPRILTSQLHTANLLPPPIILPHQLQQGNISSSHALASYSYLPPIHYVPGMPFLCPTTYASQPKKE